MTSEEKLVRFVKRSYRCDFCVLVSTQVLRVKTRSGRLVINGLKKSSTLLELRERIQDEANVAIGNQKSIKIIKLILCSLKCSLVGVTMC